MRTKFLTLVALLVAGAVRADVVIENTTAGGGQSTASTSGFTISFTNSGTSATLSTFKLFNGAGADEVAFVLTRVSGGQTYTEIRTSTAEGLFTFGGNIASAALTSSTYTLEISFLESGYDFNNTAAGTTTGLYGFSGATQTAVTGSEFLTYQLQAVPEPGTMLLGGIAAAVGGAGAWWKRRKQRLAAAEAAATPA